jgi:hypothetical protein
MPDAPSSDGTSSEVENQPAPAGDPSQPSAEGTSDGVPIDPGMTSVEPASGDGASSGAEGDSPDDEPAPLQPLTIWIAGDSTVANGNTPCPRGWGGVFASHFNDLVSVRNSAGAAAACTPGSTRCRR